MFPTVSLSTRPGPGTGPGSSIIIAAAALVVVSFLLLCEEQDHPVRAVTHCQRPPTITPFGCNCHPALTLP